MSGLLGRVTIAASLSLLSLSGDGCISSCCRPSVDAIPSARSNSLRRISKSTERYQIEVAYPRSRVAVADSTLETYVSEQMNEFIKQAEGQPGVPWQSQMILTCTTTTSAGLLCYECDNYVYVGGAHGNTNIQTFVFDRTWERTLSIDDVFQDRERTWQTISDLVIPRLKSSLGAFANDAQIEAGAGPSKDNFRHFVAAADSVLFFFEPYEVAAYAAGRQRVGVAKSELGSALRPPYRDNSRTAHDHQKDQQPRSECAPSREQQPQ